MKCDCREPFESCERCNWVIIDIDPCAKPRQTQSDKWNKRPVVLKYRSFADGIRNEFRKLNLTLGETLDCIFVISMPKSWSMKKRAEMAGEPHRQRPDIDNLEKAVMDSLCEEDSHIWKHRTEKVWGEKGMIVFRSF